jgi:sec-independent protein translocase protein TatA
MNVFGVGLPEMALILVLALLVFGPKKLPEIGRSMGKAIKGFQDASKEFEEEFKKEAQQIEKAVTSPMKASLEPDPPKALTPQEATPVETIMPAEPEVVDGPDAHAEDEANAAGTEAGGAEAAQPETLA